MAKTDAEYRDLLRSLLPKGAFWTRAIGSTLAELMYAFGGELARVEQRGEDLIAEAYAATTTETLAEWEEEYGLPEAGFDLEPTTAGRREVILAKKIAIGQQNEDYFIEIATSLGWTITIDKYPKSLASLYTIGSGPITAETGVFYWMVNIWVTDPNDANIYQLMYELTFRGEGHAQVLFRFYNVGFSRGFSNGFSAVPWWDGTWWPLGFDRGFSIGFANNSDYIGQLLTGGFHSGFSQGFATFVAGGFDFDGFDSGFSKPS